MRRVWLVFVLLTACVDVPAGIKANFAEPGPSDRSNYRPGTHGSALPVEEPPPVAKDANVPVDAAPVEPVAEGGAP